MLLVLASTSPWRLGLLESVGFAPLSIDPNVDEAKIVDSKPIKTAKLRAEAKATSAFEQLKMGTLIEPAEAGVIVAADQVVYLGDVIFGKPQDRTVWFKRLKLLRGKEHGLTTAVNIVVFKEGKLTQRIAFEETTKIHVHPDLTDEELWSYVEDGEASSCAGGYMVERKGAWLISHMDGDYSNVIGLPIPSLLRRFRELGLRPQWLADQIKTR